MIFCSLGKNPKVGYCRNRARPLRFASAARHHRRTPAYTFLRKAACCSHQRVPCPVEAKISACTRTNEKLPRIVRITSGSAAGRSAFCGSISVPSRTIATRAGSTPFPTIRARMSSPKNNHRAQLAAAPTMEFFPDSREPARLDDRAAYRHIRIHVSNVVDVRPAFQLCHYRANDPLKRRSVIRQSLRRNCTKQRAQESLAR